MSRQTRLERFASHFRTQAARRDDGRRRRLPHRRPLRFEPLEDRRLLAVVAVTTVADTIDFNDGVTSLREAIFATNIVPGPDTIEFDASLTAGGPATILLTQGELAITDSLTISGPGADLLTIDASGNDLLPNSAGGGSRIFNVDDFDNAHSADVEIIGLALTGGDGTSIGGAIFSRERLHAEGLLLTGNRAPSGGAIALSLNGATSSIVNSTFSGNVATADGGAIFVFNSGAIGTALLVGNTMTGNSANRGGAIAAGPEGFNSQLIVDGNTIMGNSASQRGGAISLTTASSTAKFSFLHSTISGNTANFQGGGLYATSIRDLAIVDSQIVENRSLATNSQQGRGGGIYATGSEIAITGSTISGNMAVAGGGVHTHNGELSISFSAVTNNSATAGDGGGIYSGGDRLSIVGSTISGNTATGIFSQAGRGGGLWHAVSSLAPTSILDSVFASNTASNYGGGADFRSVSDGIGGSLMLTNVDFTGNTSSRGGGFAFALGGQGSSSGSLLINDGTIAGNAASVNGGGIYGRTGFFQANGTTISGNQADGGGGGIATPQSGSPIMTMSFVDATIANNSVSLATPEPRGGSGNGGGIWIPSGTVSLTLLGTEVSHNFARRGGGISRGSQSASGSLSAIDSTISGNTSVLNGGGIYNIGSGALSFARTVIAGNVAGTTVLGPDLPPHGGGIFSRSADISLVNSSLSGNTSTTGRGGGLYMAQNGDLSVTGSTIAGNSARLDGGGVSASATSIDRITVVASTVSGNSSQSGIAGLYLRGNTTIRHSTISRNAGGGQRASGLMVGDGSQQIELDHTIVAGNSNSGAGPIDIGFFVSMPNVTMRSSLIGDNSGTSLVEAPVGSPDVNGNLIGKPIEMGGSGVIDPLLAPLHNNGGPTLAHALLPGSPALDAGSFVTGPPLGYDQRGNPFSRMVDGTGDGVVRIDMGAYESQGVPHFSPGDYNRDGIVDACDFTLWRDTLSEVPVTPFSGADGNGDGVVNQDDFAVWMNHFGAGLVFTLDGGGSSSFATATEPTAPALALSQAPLELASQPPARPEVSASAANRYVRSIPASAARENDALVAWLAAQAAFDDDTFAPDADEAITSADTDPVETASDAAFAAFGV